MSPAVTPAPSVLDTILQHKRAELAAAQRAW